MTHRLFSYGTLRHPHVQTELFGGPVPTTEDSLPGWRLDWVTITDPDVLATSGEDRHPILHPGSADDHVAGVALEVTDAQLAAADAYEVDDYARTLITLNSGHEAWVYVAAER